VRPPEPGQGEGASKLLQDRRLPRRLAAGRKIRRASCPSRKKTVAGASVPSVSCAWTGAPVTARSPAQIRRAACRSRKRWLAPLSQASLARGQGRLSPREVRRKFGAPRADRENGGWRLCPKRLLRVDRGAGHREKSGANSARRVPLAKTVAGASVPSASCVWTEAPVTGFARMGVRRRIRANNCRAKPHDGGQHDFSETERARARSLTYSSHAAGPAFPCQVCGLRVKSRC